MSESNLFVIRNENMAAIDNRHLSNYLGGGFWQISKRAIKAFGLKKTLFITHLIDWRMKLLEMGEIQEDDFFYITQSNIKEETGLSEKAQYLIIDFLVEQKLLSVKRKGLPAQNWYRINIADIIEYIEFTIAEQQEEKNVRSRSAKTSDQDTPNSPIIFNNNKGNNNKEKESYSFRIRGEQGKDPAPPVDDIFVNYRRESKELFQFWNEFEKPFLHHREAKSDIFVRAMKHLDSVLNRGYSTEEIGQAMILYSKMLNSAEYVVSNIKTPGNLVGLDEFFKFNKRKEDLIIKQEYPAYGISSWFDECIKGEEYLRQKYMKKKSIPAKYKEELIPDKFPDVTKRLRMAWSECEFSNSNKLTDKDENNFRKAASMFVEYFKKNKRRIDFDDGGSLDNVFYMCEALKMALEENSVMVITTGWLCTDAMFNERLHKYFDKRGMIID